jgi:hypothetical protein
LEKNRDLPCAPCHEHWRANDEINHNHGCRLCLACDGVGERKRRKDDVRYEAYSGLAVTELEAAIASSKMVQRRTPTAHVEPEGVVSEYAWVKERNRFYAAGSYEELDFHLAWLKDRYPMRYETVLHWASEFEDPIWSWSDTALGAIAQSMEMLADRMPDNLRVPNWVAARWRVEKRAAA